MSICSDYLVKNGCIPDLPDPFLKSGTSLQGSYRSGKTGKSQGILVVREIQAKVRGKYFFGKVREMKIGATRCQILMLRCIKFVFRWAPPQTPLGELTALPQAP